MKKVNDFNMHLTIIIVKTWTPEADELAGHHPTSNKYRAKILISQMF